MLWCLAALTVVCMFFQRLYASAKWPQRTKCLPAGSRNTLGSRLLATTPQKVAGWQSMAKCTTSLVRLRLPWSNTLPPFNFARVLAWMSKHPGGTEILLLAAGRDISDAFESYHPFSDKPAMILQKFEIGVLSTHEHPTYKPDSGFYKVSSKSTQLSKQNKTTKYKKIQNKYKFLLCFFFFPNANFFLLLLLFLPFEFGAKIALVAPYKRLFLPK